jgi:hypothetical protein
MFYIFYKFLCLSFTLFEWAKETKEEDEEVQHATLAYIVFNVISLCYFIISFEMCNTRKL